MLSCPLSQANFSSFFFLLGCSVPHACRYSYLSGKREVGTPLSLSFGPIVVATRPLTLALNCNTTAHHRTFCPHIKVWQSINRRPKIEKKPPTPGESHPSPIHSGHYYHGRLIPLARSPRGLRPLQDLSSAHHTPYPLPIPRSRPTAAALLSPCYFDC